MRSYYILFLGLTYNGENEHGEAQWNGLENIGISIFENTTEFNHYIQSFNVNTNHWVAQYVYKRLKFLGNRQFSQLTALLFLSVWHGLHSGYYVCFFFEFLVIYMERDVSISVGFAIETSTIPFPDKIDSEEQRDALQLLWISQNAAASADTSKDLHLRFYGLVSAALQLAAIR